LPENLETFTQNPYHLFMSLSQWERLKDWIITAVQIWNGAQIGHKKQR